MASKLKVEISASADGFIKSMDDSKKSVDEFAKKAEDASGELGKMDSQTKNATGSVNNLTNAQRKAALEALNHSKAVRQANKELKNMESNAKSAMGSLNGAISSLRSGDIMGFTSSIKNAGLSFKALVPACTSGVGAVGGLTGAFGALGTAITTALGPVGLIAAGVAAFGAVAYEAISANEDYTKSLNSFSALTGMTGSALDDMGDRAREMGLKYGIAATDILESMKTIGSQAPQLLQDADAMEEVTESAIVLSKAAGIDVTDAAKGLTTVLNQMGVSADESKDIINSLAAGSKNGAGDVAYLQTAIEKTGSVAKSSGMSYQELIGTIETLAPSFSSADVAGTALKGTLLKLTTQGNANFNPAVVGMQTALKNLADANLSASDMVKLFGESNVTAATLLINNRKELAEMTDKVTDTNTAFEQMDIQSGSLEGAWKKLKTACQDLWIELGQSDIMKAVVVLIHGVVDAIMLLINSIKLGIKTWQTFFDVTKALWNKFLKWIEPVTKKINDKLDNSKILNKVLKQWDNFKSAIYEKIKKIAGYWNTFMKWLGLESKEINLDTKVNTKVKVNKPKVTNPKPETNTETKTTKTKTKKGKTDAQKQAEKAQRERERQAKKAEEEAKKLQEKIDDITSQIEEKTNEKTYYASIGLDTSEIDIEIAKLNEKLNAIGADYDSAGIENVKENIIKEMKDIAPNLDFSGLYDNMGKIKPDTETLKKMQSNLTNKVKGVNSKSDDINKELKSKSTERDYHVSLKLDTSKMDVEIAKLNEKLNAIGADYDAESIKKVKQSIIDEMKDISPNLDFSSLYDDMGNITPDLETLYKLDEEIKDVHDDYKEKIEAGNDAVASLGSTINSVAGVIGDLFSMDEDANGFDWISTIANGLSGIISQVPSVIQGITAIQAANAASSAQEVANKEAEALATTADTGAKAGNALAGAASSGASLPFPANIAAIAAGVAAVLAVIGTIASAASKAKKHATGGIIGGSTTVGDKVLARLNAGEMVLNNRQQAHLFKMLDTSSTSKAGNANQTITFRLKGSDIIGAVKNYNTRHNS